MFLVPSCENKRVHFIMQVTETSWWEQDCFASIRCLQMLEEEWRMHVQCVYIPEVGASLDGS